MYCNAFSVGVRCSPLPTEVCLLNECRTGSALLHVVKCKPKCKLPLTGALTQLQTVSDYTVDDLFSITAQEHLVPLCSKSHCMFCSRIFSFFRVWFGFKWKIPELEVQAATDIQSFYI